MVRLLVSLRVQPALQHWLPISAIVAACFLLPAGFAGTAKAQDGRYARASFARPSTTEPGQVFSSGVEAAPLGDDPNALTSGSRFFDYRSSQPKPAGIAARSGRNGPVQQVAFNGSGGCQSCNKPQTFSPIGSPSDPATFGKASPYASQRYANSPGLGTGSGYGAIPSAGYSEDPRFPTPYASSFGSTVPSSVSAGIPAGGGYSSLDPCSGAGGYDDPGTGGYVDPRAGRGDCLLYLPFTSMGYYGGTTPSTGVSELFVPLLETHTDMLYADIRGAYTTSSAYVGSFGGGMRSLLFDSMVLGGYGFYDFIESTQINRFQQAVVGVELMTYRWEVRSNGYIPTSQNMNCTGGGSTGTAVLQNGLIFLNGGSGQSALAGLDAEIGALLAVDSTGNRELRAFVGGYNFYGQGDCPNVPGVFWRLDARIYDLNFLGPGSRLEFGTISSYDDVNKYQITGLLNVRVSLGSTNCPGGMSRIERRMLDRIVRRQSFISECTACATEAASTTVCGQKYSSVLVVDATTPNLQAQLNAAPANQLVAVKGDAGTVSVPNGITLNSGQALIGGGSHLTVTGNSSGHTATLILPGSTPTIDRSNGTGATVTMSSNTSIMGVNVTGGMPAILAQNVNNVCLSNVTASQSFCDGLQFLTVNGLMLENVTITQNSEKGLTLQNVTNATLTNINISQTLQSGIFCDTSSNIQITGLNINATGTTDDALKLSNVTNLNLSNSQISNTPTGLNAMKISTSSGVTLDQIAFSNITGDGIALIDSSSLAVTNSIFTNVNNDLAFIGTLSQISGSNNTSTGETTLFTGTTAGGGSISFTTPNAVAQ